MTPSLQCEETHLDQEIVKEVIALTPESWRSAMLVVTYSDEGGVQRYAHEISNPQGRREPITPSDELLDATHRLGQLFEKHGRRWRVVTYRIDIDGDGEGRYVAEFSY